MTREELFLLNELIKETVKSVVKETLKESQNNDSLKKELKEVKLLLAKVIKEGHFSASPPSNPSKLTEEQRSKIRESVMGDFETVISKTTKNVSPVIKMSAEQAVNISVNGTLPDVDAPIPFIDKKSVVWKDFKEKHS